MYTPADIAAVIAYNATANIFSITDNKRVVWHVNNGNKQHLQTILSRRFAYAEDFAQLKKQVRSVLKQQQLV